MIDLHGNSVVYITRDIERALGLPLDTPGYSIISNATSFAKSKAKGKKNVLLLESDALLSTWELLHRPETEACVKQHKANILVFKNTPQIERFCAEKEWTLLNPPAALAATVEGKISQIEWLGEERALLPLIAHGPMKDLVWTEKCVLQFNTSHTGSGTFLLASTADFAQLQERFPERPARLMRFINGPVYTNNNVVTAGDVRVGNVSYQITGLAPFTDNPFATIGNDWALGKQVDQDAYAHIARRVGKRLQAAGWKGAFGIDVMQDGNGKLWLIEINARQPASLTYESKLQQGLTTFDAHLLSVLGIESGEPLARIDSGAQLMIRATDERTALSEKQQQALTALGLHAISSSSTKPGTELLRLQTKDSFMTSHEQLNALGNQIKGLL